MLIEKQFIQVLKLDSGEEIITKINNQDSDYYFVNNPFVLIAGQAGLQFSPMFLMADTEAEVKISKAHVLAECKPSTGMQTGYEKATSALVLPTKPGIII